MTSSCVVYKEEFMCEHLGISFNGQIRPRLSLRGLSIKSDFHSDAWGLAYFPGKSTSAIIFTKPIAECDSQLASFLLNHDQIKSHIFCRVSIGKKLSVEYAPVKQGL